MAPQNNPSCDFGQFLQEIDQNTQMASRCIAAYQQQQQQKQQLDSCHQNIQQWQGHVNNLDGLHGQLSKLGPQGQQYDKQIGYGTKQLLQQASQVLKACGKIIKFLLL